jgi:hypothetical protein
MNAWTLPDECIACGAENSYVRELTKSEKSFHSNIFMVEHHHWKCNACGVGVLGDVEIDEIYDILKEVYRQNCYEGSEQIENKK